MPRFKLILEYDGERYKGWQVHKSESSIMGELIGACRKVFLDEPFELYGAERTDYGVHALWQVAHIDVKTIFSPYIILRQLNDNLPPDINVLQLDEAPKPFHAAHDVVARSYIYQISKRRHAFGKKFMWWIKDELDVELMQQAANLLVGQHNFRSFVADKEQHTANTELLLCKVHSVGSMLYVHLVARYFYPKMERRMVGMLVDVGREKTSLDAVRKLVTLPTETSMLTAPPAGLFLERVYYGSEEIDKQFQTLL